MGQSHTDSWASLGGVRTAKLDVCVHASLVLRPGRGHGDVVLSCLSRWAWPRRGQSRHTQHAWLVVQRFARLHDSRLLLLRVFFWCPMLLLLLLLLLLLFFLLVLVLVLVVGPHASACSSPPMLLYTTVSYFQSLCPVSQSFSFLGRLLERACLVCPARTAISPRTVERIG
jgi:hypothetical protein